jgi:hypothetical protein
VAIPIFQEWQFYALLIVLNASLQHIIALLVQDYSVFTSSQGVVTATPNVPIQLFPSIILVLHARLPVLLARVLSITVLPVLQAICLPVIQVSAA